MEILLADMFAGELVHLTPFNRDDLPTLTGWYNDYEVARMMDDDEITLKTSDAQEVWYHRITTDKSTYPFAIRTLTDDQLLGECLLHSLNASRRYATVGIVIGDKSQWGKGYGTDAMRVLLRYAFLELNLNRVQLWVFDYNERGIRSYEKCGFVREGTARQMLYREGAYHNIHLMAVLREDWLVAQRR